MPQMIDCPECGATLRIKDELLGKQVRCPGCSVVLSTEKPSSTRKKPAVVEDEEGEDLPVNPRAKKRIAARDAAREEQAGPPKWLVPAIIGGTVLLLVVVIGGLVYLVFGTNLLTPPTRPKPTEATQPTPPTASPPTVSPPTASPPTGEAPAVDQWARKTIPGTKVSIEIPQASLPGDLAGALADLGAGGISGMENSLAGPRIYAASVLPDILGGGVDVLGGIEDGIKKDANSQVLHKYQFLGRPALMVRQKGAGLPAIQLYIQDGNQTITLTVSGLGVNDMMPSIKRFFSSIKFEK